MTMCKSNWLDTGSHCAFSIYRELFASMIWSCALLAINILTHWGWVAHICVSKLTIIASDNGLSPNRRQAIIWTKAGILLFRPLGTNFSEMLIEIHVFSFRKMSLKMSSAKCRPSSLGLNMLKCSAAPQKIILGPLQSSHQHHLYFISVNHPLFTKTHIHPLTPEARCTNMVWL